MERRDIVNLGATLGAEREFATFCRAYLRSIPLLLDFYPSKSPAKKSSVSLSIFRIAINLVYTIRNYKLDQTFHSILDRARGAAYFQELQNFAELNYTFTRYYASAARLRQNIQRLPDSAFGANSRELNEMLTKDLLVDKENFFRELSTCFDALLRLNSEKESQVIDENIAKDRSDFGNGRSLEQCLDAPLWIGGKISPNSRAKWQRFSVESQSYLESWHVWTLWYQRCLEGSWAAYSLDRAKFKLPEALWNGSVKEINQEIDGIEENYLAESVRGGCIVAISEESGKFTVESRVADNASRFENARDKAVDCIKFLKVGGLNNQFSALSDPIEKFVTLIEVNPNNPSRVYDAVLDIYYEIIYLLDKEEIPEGVEMSSVLRNLQDASIEIRVSDHEVNARALSIAKIRFREPSSLELEQQKEIVNAAIQISDDDLMAKLKNDEIEEKDSIERKAEKTFRTASTLSQMKRISNQPGNKIEKKIKSTTSRVDYVNKIVKFGENISEYWPVVKNYFMQVLGI